MLMMFSQALGQELRLLWGDFEGCLLDAGEFVATQTPMKAQGLQESIVVSEEWEGEEGRGEGRRVLCWRLENLCPLRLQ